ncbi:neck protein [Arthrobacter phage Marchesin]|nr:neck protein [Arthrobacter phage Marchesin]
MASKITRIVFKSKGFRQILRSQAVVADLARRGQAIADAAGDGVGIQVSVGANRARVTVATETREAAAAEATDKTLTRAIGAGRG